MISFWAMKTRTWMSDMASRNSADRNWFMYWANELKSCRLDSSILFSTGKCFLSPLSTEKVDTGVMGELTGMSTRRYSTGRGLPILVISFPYSSFSLKKWKFYQSFMYFLFIKSYFTIYLEENVWNIFLLRAFHNIGKFRGILCGHKDTIPD